MVSKESKVKLHISFPFEDNPMGGGNQFLKALRKNLIKLGSYTDNPNEADVFLFNSHHNLWRVLKLKLIYPKKPFIHRIDGPIALYSDDSDKRDRVVRLLNKLLADATVFQSNWSKAKNHELGLDEKDLEAVVNNAPDPEIFYGNSSDSDLEKKKYKIISTCWSPNMKKGFKVYKWLDENLDFNRFEMDFVGNSPVEFKNIKLIPPLASKDLAEKLRSSDVFITASEDDPCSNSLLEAVHSRIPVIALKSGGHPEILRERGFLFENKTEIPKILDGIVSGDLKFHAKPEGFFTLEDAVESYLSFAGKVLDHGKNPHSSITTFIKFILKYAGIKLS